MRSFPSFKEQFIERVLGIAPVSLAFPFAYPPFMQIEQPFVPYSFGIYRRCATIRRNNIDQIAID